MSPSTINEIYGKRIRIRVCGILVKNGAILLAKHVGVGEKGFLWAPPGGGLELGETISEGIIREFKEECNLDVTVGSHLFNNEFINLPLHAVEIFHEVRLINNDQENVLGKDPETPHLKMITDLRYFTLEEMQEDPNEFHKSTLNWAKKRSE